MPLPPADASDKSDPRLLPLPEEVAPEPDTSFSRGTPLAVTIGTGYALRIQTDERNHGANGRLALDVPLLWGFGVRGEIDANAWGPSARAPRPLALGLGALSLIYAVDEGPVTGLLGVGVAGGYGLDVVDATDPSVDPAVIANSGIYGGALLSVGIRFRLGPTTQLEIAGILPVMLLEPTGLFFRAPFGADRGGLFPFQPALSVGLVFEPIAFAAGVLRGDPIWALVAPSEFGSLLDLFAF